MRAFTLTQDDNPLIVIDGVRRAHRRHSSARNDLIHLVAKMRGSRVILVDGKPYVETPRMHLDLEYPVKPRISPKELLPTHLSPTTTFNAQTYLAGNYGYSVYFPNSWKGVQASPDSQRISRRVLQLSLARARADVVATERATRRLSTLLTT